MNPSASPIAAFLADLHAEIAGITDGKPASYIPELAKADPALFGIALATVDGQFYTAGDVGHRFTIQSVSKPFIHADALSRLGRAAVLAKVGVEPSGEAFNSIVFDEEHHRPFNPMVNAGAIAATELIAGRDVDEKRAAMADIFTRFAGRELDLDEAVYASEAATGHRNRAIAWMMLSAGMIQGDPDAILDLYFRQCSLLVDCRDLALMAATLANGGINPATRRRALPSRYVRDVLTVMDSCGMYNFAGQWAYEIGMPAKSGVSGSILAVIPGQAGLAIFSPPIDGHGSSVRGVVACRRIAQEFGLQEYRSQPAARNAVRMVARGDVLRSRRTRLPAERQLLDARGSRICVIEIQDALFFGSCERLLRRAGACAGDADWLILDFRRVNAADRAARALLGRFGATLRAAGGMLIYAGIAEDGPLGALHRQILAEGDVLFEDRDRALEYCEDRLIAAATPAIARPAEIGAEDFEIFRGIAPADLAHLADLGRHCSFAGGTVIFAHGDHATSLFVLTSGSASVVLPLDAGRERSLRIAAIGPGMSAGEVSLVDDGVRSADIVADGPVTAMEYAIADLRALGREKPSILIALLGNIAHDLAERLRRANGEIRALGD